MRHPTSIAGRCREWVPGRTGAGTAAPCRGLPV
jgi:hypothetical protein